VRGGGQPIGGQPNGGQPIRAAQRYAPRPLTAGELWTADALLELRRGRYRPDAWLRFVRDSLRRSSQTRRARPRLASQSRRWGLTGALAWLLACRATRDRHEPPLPPIAGLAWWLTVWQMLDWHLGMAEGGDGRPRARLSNADAVTLVRFWLVPVLPAAASSPAALPAVILAGGVTDWLDGALARRDGRTRLGRDLDSTADLAFVMAAALAGRRAGRITPLAFRALAVRQIAGVVLAAVAMFGRARRPAIRARRWGAMPRIAGLALCTSGMRRTGTIIELIGCLVPPRPTARHLSPF
jgi:phosphatidylglycerophosphate synthase